MLAISKKKIIPFLLCCVIILVFLIMPVSALSVSNSPNNNGLKTESIAIKVEGYSPAQDWAVTVDGSDSGGGMSKYVVYTSDYSPIPANTSFTVTAYIKADTTYVNDKYYCYGNYSFATRRNSGYEITKVNESYRYYQGENYLLDCYQSADVVEETIVQDFPSVKSTFNTQSLGAKFDTYVVSFDVIIPTQTNALIFYLYAVNFEMIDPATNAIIDNQNENTDKLIEAEKELQENEKNEAHSSGSGGVDDVASAVPDQSEGFMSAIKTFVRSMSTTDTECSLTFPAIIIPAIGGLFPETKLSEEHEIDFSEVFELMPVAIMAIIQALTTIGLIYFCYKEFYGTIDYALTLRKGDSG